MAHLHEHCESCSHEHGHHHESHETRHAHETQHAREAHEHHHAHDAHEHHHDHSLRRQLWLIIATVVLLVVAVLIERGSNSQFSILNSQFTKWQLLLVYLVPYILIGHETLHEAWEGIMKGDAFNEHFLMSVATIGALCIGFLPGAETEFPEAVFVMLFFQVGELFEGYAEGKSRDSIAHLMDIRPDVAHVEDNTAGFIDETELENHSVPQKSVQSVVEIKDVSPEAVGVGATIVIRPGEKVPLDGVIVEGASALNTVALTGESLPRDVNVGDEVISGCVNLSGVLRVRTTKAFGESTVSKIISLVENAGERKSQSETFITRFARIYTPVVVFLAIAIAILPPLFIAITQHLSPITYFPTWLYRALMFLVVSCPCALVISVPLTFFGGIGGASRKGILIKGANYMDVLAKVDTVVFDKTGTLTHGRFAVSAVHPDTCDEHQLLHLAAHVEHFTTHPIGAALRDAFPDEATDGCQVSDVEEIAGHGIRARVGDQQVCVGNTKMMDAIGAKWSNCPLCGHDGHAVGTVIHVAIDGKYAGHIVINDEIKADSAEAIAALQQLGVKKTVMLTGDRKEVADHVARQLGITEYHAELLPSDKVGMVEQLLHPFPSEGAGGGSSSEGAGGGSSFLAFVGDGINDAPVLARADVGIAMGGLGSDAAIEAADVVLMDDQPSKIALAIRVARRTLTIARQNVWFAIGVKVAVLLLAAFGLATMWLAVFADVGVTVLAVLNAMRALRVDEGGGSRRSFFKSRWVRILGWLLAALVAFSVLVTLLVAYCRPVQHWLVTMASETLSKELKTEVTIDRVGLSLIRQRLTINGLCLKDQQNADLLKVDEVTGEVHLLGLLRGSLMVKEFKINNMDVMLKNPADGPANYQFLLDATRKDTTNHPSPSTHHPAPLKIDLRHFQANRVAVSYNDIDFLLKQMDYSYWLGRRTMQVEHLQTHLKQQTKKGPVDWHFDSGLVTATMADDGPKHVDISGLVIKNDNHRPRRNTGKPHHGAFDAGHLNLTADLGLDIHHAGKDSLLATLTHCTAQDSVAGIDLTQLTSDIALSGRHLLLSNLVVQQVTTRIQIPVAHVMLPDKKQGTPLTYQADTVSARVMLKDIAKPFAPALSRFSIPLNLKVGLNGSAQGMLFRDIRVNSDDRQLSIRASGILRNLDKARELTLNFSVLDMVARANTAQKIIDQFTVKKFMMKQLYALGTIKYIGDFDILWHKEKFRGVLNTVKGNIDFDFQLDGNTRYVSGRVHTDSLKLGEVFQLKNLGTIDCSANFNIDYSKKRTAAIRKKKGGKLPIGTVEADVRSVGYRNIRLKNIVANIVSDGAIAEGDVTMKGKMTDLMLRFSFTNTSEMNKMKVKVKPKLKFHKRSKG